MYYAKNPILPGFRPDPSICRVGEDYYLVTSSFAYFPGVPVYHSRDLAHWEQIGNVLDRETQLPLKGCGNSQGIFAPTIRFHEGIYYMITTNISGGGNFVVTAEEPEGPWSEPYYLGEEAQGIDPSLFFDTDGTCYYVGTRPNGKGVRYNGDWEIWVQELNLETMKLTGESHKIWKGAMHHGIWPEGPHLYKKGSYYYLLHAEGGTGMEHAVCAARSKEIFGRYEGSPCNPIFTHRHLGADYPVVMAGHGDLVDDGQGNWYIVMLGTRRIQGYGNTGRDTYLAKVTWENDWPVINAGVGKLEEQVELPGKPVYARAEKSSWHFYGTELPPEFMLLRGAGIEKYSLKARKGSLRLFTGPYTLGEKETPAYVCVRQQGYHFRVSALFEFQAKQEAEEAGIAIVCDESNYIRFVKTYWQGASYVKLIACEKGKELVLAQKRIEEGSMELHMVCHEQCADFYCYVQETRTESLVAKQVNMRKLSTEEAGGFTGCTIGMYASANGKITDNYADFLFYSCEEIRE